MRAPAWLPLATCLAATLAIWVLDTVAEEDLRFGFVYMLPLAASAWWGTRRVALVCATVASFALVANDLTLRPGPTLFVNLWNEFTRVTTFYAIVLVISAVRHSAERMRVESERAFRLAVTDQLTGLYNRHYLMEQLARIHPAAVRHQRPYALLAIDLDGFKRINDVGGHTAGDEALASFAEQLRAAARADDILVRSGGDEFVVLQPEATEADAAALAERLNATLAVAGGIRRVGSVSAGAVAWRPYVTPAVLLAEADRLVYESKRRGGGRVSRAQQLAPAP